jgi:hypothetical protein
MGQRKMALLAAGLVACLLMAGAVLAAPRATTLDHWVVGGGGGRVETGPYTLDGTIGQPVVGKINNAGYELGAGFWYGIDVGYRLYLPLVLREF